METQQPLPPTRSNILDLDILGAFNQIDSDDLITRLTQDQKLKMFAALKSSMAEQNDACEITASSTITAIPNSTESDSTSASSPLPYQESTLQDDSSPAASHSLSTPPSSAAASEPTDDVLRLPKSRNIATYFRRATSAHDPSPPARQNPPSTSSVFFKSSESLISNKQKFKRGPYVKHVLNKELVAQIYASDKAYFRKLMESDELNPENPNCCWVLIDAIGNHEATHMAESKQWENRLYPPWKYFIAFGESTNRGKTLHHAGADFVSGCLGQRRFPELHPWFMEAVRHFCVRDRWGTLMTIRPQLEYMVRRGVKREREEDEDEVAALELEQADRGSRITSTMLQAQRGAGAEDAVVDGVQA